MGLDHCFIFISIYFLDLYKYILVLFVYKYIFCRIISCDPTCKGISRFPHIRKACWLVNSRDYEDLKKVIPAALELHKQPGLGLQQTSSFVLQRNSILTYRTETDTETLELGVLSLSLIFHWRTCKKLSISPFFFTLLNCQFSIRPHTLAGMALNGCDPYRALVHTHRAYSQQPGGDNHLQTPDVKEELFGPFLSSFCW